MGKILDRACNVIAAICGAVLVYYVVVDHLAPEAPSKASATAASITLPSWWIIALLVVAVLLLGTNWANKILAYKRTRNPHPLLAAFEQLAADEREISILGSNEIVPAEPKERVPLTTGQRDQFRKTLKNLTAECSTSALESTREAIDEALGYIDGTPGVNRGQAYAQFHRVSDTIKKEIGRKMRLVPITNTRG